MVSDNIISHFYSSVILLTQNIIKSCKDDGLSNDVGFINWDAHVDEKDIPQTDLIGMRHFNVWEEDNILHVGCGFGVSTYNDKNLFRHIQLISRVYDFVKPGVTHDLVDAENGQRHTFLTAQAGTSIPPMYQTDTRQLQVVLASFGTGVSA